ncbi:MAG: hypothetical protein ACRD3M_07455 [Thermoanaerobaculia bacterium]
MVLLQADEIFACLESHGVRYVVIGGLAAVLHGSPLATFDADICPKADENNRERLAAALREMDARIRTPDVPEGVRFACDAAFLARTSILNLVTRFGELDISFTPSGTTGYEDLDAGAAPMKIGGLSIRVAALADVIRSKEAANRPKDQRALPLLRRLLEETRKGTKP